MSDKADLYEKTDRYHGMLEEALSNLRVTQMGEEIEKIVDEFLTMAESYYRDGIHFRKEGDMVNALICFTYGHGWIDAGVRLGIFAVNR